MSSIEARKNKIHSIWNEGVEQCRQKLNMPKASPQELIKWLSDIGRENFLAIVESEFVQLEDRVSITYFPYFLACILAHHPGAGNIHALPGDLFFPAGPDFYCFYPRVRLPDYRTVYPGQGYFRVYYTLVELKDMLQAPPGWNAVGLPWEGEVWWPNVLDFEGRTPEIKTWEGHTVNWAHIEIFAYASGGELYIPPLLYGPAVAGKSLHTVLGLDPNTVIVKGVAHIPLLHIRGPFVTPDHVWVMWVNLAPARGLVRWQPPQVHLTPLAGKWDREIGAIWERFIKENFLPRNFQVERGRPKREQPSPGSDYLEYLRQVHKEKIFRKYEELRPSEQSKRLDRDKLIKIRESSWREVRKKFQIRKKPLDSLWEEIEETIIKEYQSHLEKRQAK